jgi:tetratricopeptide (TPR) repeat protein
MDRETDRSVEHLPLEEVRLGDVSVTAPPAGWTPAMDTDGPHPPPVLVHDTGGLTLVGNHNTFWRAASMGRTTIRCLVVRSAVHVVPAHESINNAGEEPLLFQGLLAAGIVENRSRLADMLGFSRARITQVLNLLKLPLELRREVLADNTITEYQLRPLIRIEGADQQLAMFRELQSKRLTGRQMALYADSAPATPAEEVKPTGRVTEPEPVSTADELEAAFSQAQPEVIPQNRDRAPAAGPGKESTPPRFTSADDTPSREILKILPRLGTLREKEWRSAAAEAGADKLDMRFLEGVSLLRRGMFADSMDTLSDVIRRSPDYSAAWYFMGKCANLTGALTDAEEYLRNAIERDPKQPDFYLELAVVLEKQKRDTEALTLFRKANSIRRSKRSNEKV